MVPDLWAGWEQIDFDNFGKRINLGVTIAGPRGELEYLAGLMGIVIYTDYLLLTKEEVLVIYSFVVRLNEQGKLLLECEEFFKKAEAEVIKERQVGEWNRTLNWVLGGTSIGLLGLVIYFGTH